MFRNDQQLRMWKEFVVAFEANGHAFLELKRTERGKLENISGRTACNTLKLGNSRITH
jgi:hypothetical protein